MGIDEVADFGHLLECGKACCKGGRHKHSVQAFEMTLLRYTARNKKKIDNETFQPKQTNDFKLLERGKWRDIKAHHIEDRQIYKSLVQYAVDPAIKNSILENNCASQVGKGTEYSIAQFRQGLAKAYRKYKTDFYVVTADYHDYFGSIPHDNIRSKIVMSDEKCETLMSQYIEVFSGTHGIGIGGEPSQKIAIAYPAILDRTLACDPRVIDSGRYMDDIYAICHTKEDAKNILNVIIKTSEKLQLQLNSKRTKISWMKKESVVWLKKRTHITDSGKIIMQLTKKNVRNRIRWIKKQRELINNGEMPIRTAFESMQCWASYAVKYNTYHQMMKVIKVFMEQFNVPWDVAKKLFKKKKSDFIKVCKNRNFF